MIPELYKIKMYLNSEHLHFTIPLIDVQETRLLNGWSYDKKRGSTRNDGMPVGIYDELHINTRSDYAILLPDGLPEEFTSSDVAVLLKMSKGAASLMLNVMNYTGAVGRAGKKGRAYLYRRLF